MFLKMLTQESPKEKIIDENDDARFKMMLQILYFKIWMQLKKIN